MQGNCGHLDARTRSTGTRRRSAAQAYKLPFVDKIIYRTIKDEATLLTALRTGKLDVLEPIRWSAVDELKKSAPAAAVERARRQRRSFVALRVDTQAVRRHPRAARAEHGDRQAGDRQVLLRRQRRAVRLPDAPRLHRLLRAARADARRGEGAVHVQPGKAKQLLAEAGYPKGFSFKVQVCAVSTDNMDLLPLVAALSRQGRREDRDPAAGVRRLLRRMTTQDQRAGLLHVHRRHQPDRPLRKSFVTKQTWNPSQYVDPEIDQRMAEVYARARRERAPGNARKLMTREIIEKAPYIWLPSPYLYTAGGRG